MSPATKFLAALPVLRISALPQDCQSCSICQEGYLTAGTTNEHPVSLPCHHIFGQYCIQQWLSPDGAEPRSTCPMCRTTLFSNNEQPAEAETTTYETDSTTTMTISTASLPTDPLTAATHIINSMRDQHRDDIWTLKTNLINLYKATHLMTHDITTELQRQMFKDDEEGVMAAFKDLHVILTARPTKDAACELVVALNHATAEMLNRMEAEAEAEEKRYGDNMTILCAEMKKKLGAGYAAEIECWDAALNLANRVEGMPEAPYHARYLKEIAEYWRKTGGTSEARAYEEVWTFVAGRVLRQE